MTGGRTGPHGYTQVNEDEVLVGSVVADRYDVKEVLGQGTTGTVFLVEHLVTGRPAAMKVLRAPYVASDVLLRVFHGEARAAWSLPHPALAEVFDAGQLPDGAPFVAMERLVGETLATRLQRDRLSIGAGVDMMMQLLAALAAVHERDMILRDLRPQNIHLGFRRGCRPVVKILDFGLARLVPLDRVQEDWDALRAVLGGSDAAGSLALPYYLSPERTRSEHGLGPAHDLFVAGVIFYEALTGHKPFVSTSFNGLLLQIAQSRPAPMSDFRQDIPPELDALVARTLAQQPSQRPSSAGELQDELRAVFERGKRNTSRPRIPTASASGQPVALPAGVAKAPPAPSASFGVPPGVGTVTPSAPIAPLTPPSGAPKPPGRIAPPPASTTAISASQAPSTSRSETDRRPSSAPSYSSIPISATSIPAPPTAGEALAMGIAGLRIPTPAALPVTPDPFEEETRTDRSVSSLLAADPSVAAYAAAHADEASAESPLRTVPPPRGDVGFEIEVDVDAGDETERTRKADVARRKPAADDDDETATMELTPEVRARIEEMTRARAAQPSAPPSRPDPEGPPQTRRMK